MISDETLAEQALHGNLSAFEELVNRYKNIIYSVIYRIVCHQQEAEDIAQEVFLNVYQKLYQFNMNRKFGPWIYRIAVNTSISSLRKNKKVVTLNFEENIKPYDNQPFVNISDPQLNFERKELLEEINAAILEINESYRIVLVLRYQMDLNNKEIADILGLSRENVEVRIHRARKALRKVLLKRWQERGNLDGLPASR